MFRVTMQFGGKPVRKYTFDKDVIAIGRDATCDIVIENIGASRRHATIERTEDGYVLADLKSHNGTFVNGEKIFHHRLNDADEFFIGKFAFVFESLEPVVEVVGDGLEPAPRTGPVFGGGASPGAAAALPDMTFRLDRKDIEKIIGHSARGTAPQLVQLEPEQGKGKFQMEKAYCVIGAHPSADVRVAGLFAPSRAAVVVRGDHGYRILCLSPKVKVNDRHAPDSPLVDGDLVSCGRYRFRFCQG